MKRILAVKLADLGDLLSVTPALRALRNGYPQAHIAALVTPSSKGILAGSTSVDEVIPVEKALFEEEGLKPPVRIMPYVVDAPAREPASPEGRRDIVFLGGFGHPPNRDAVLWFVQEVWPIVRRAAPQSRFVIVGAKPPPEIRGLADDRLIVTGLVDELEPYMAAARVFVAPLRFGAGVKGKLYAALAAGAPIVATPIGAEGMGLQDGRHALIAETPEAFAHAVLKLCSDDGLWRGLSDAGRDFIRRGHTPDAGRDALAEILRTAGA